VHATKAHMEEWRHSSTHSYHRHWTVCSISRLYCFISRDRVTPSVEQETGWASRSAGTLWRRKISTPAGNRTMIPWMCSPPKSQTRLPQCWRNLTLSQLTGCHAVRIYVDIEMLQMSHRIMKLGTHIFVTIKSVCTPDTCYTNGSIVNC
jgi:hypothetical protein